MAAAAAGQTPQVDASALAAACVPPGEADRPLAALPEARRLELIACANRQAAAQLNAQTPIRVDEITTLESVSSVGTNLIYSQRVNVEARTITTAMRSNLDQTVRAYVCGNEQMRNTISYGGAYTYVWVDRAGTFIHRLEIGRC